MEFCPKTLRGYLEETRERNLRQAFVFFKQIVLGVKFIHEKNVIHRDLKPANIFLVKDTIKIGDFGLAKAPIHNEEDSIKLAENRGPNGIRRTHSVSSDVGTPLYFAPEQDKKNYDNKVDIFAIGLIFLELNVNFSTSHERIMLFNAIREKGKLPSILVNDDRLARQAMIIRRLVALSPQERPSAREILQLEEFRSLQTEYGVTREDD
eukprot:TRINITY_DN12712_c0_g1_i4.p1 TRINITY_DN12712_c0_g1~~TRINITY_DN12712_c0_g1_i4.p1  ORF type:complete len:208 (+),score=44.73 TRINITY_DN12712_c0_g1_i4:137-760(+)